MPPDGIRLTKIVTIRGDSRAFDTYYTSAAYSVRYGYNSTFAPKWRAAALADAGYDVVHIPDHFRGGTVQNNSEDLATRILALPIHGYVSDETAERLVGTLRDALSPHSGWLLAKAL